MELNLKEKYNQICFSLKQKEEELEKLRTDLFILNPDVMKLVQEIHDLNQEKYKIKAQLEDKIDD